MIKLMRFLSMTTGCILATILVLSFFSVSSAATGFQIPWEAKIRPGVASGSQDNPTDFFTDFFLPFWGTKKNVLFLNPVVRMDDDDGHELNLGIGFRQFMLNDKLILGGNLFYDTMQSASDFSYQQWGAGFEALSPWLDVRANYYSPFGDTEHRIAALDIYSFGPSSLLVNRGFEEALEGFDTEAGLLLPYISDYVETRVALGYYRYDADKMGDAIDGSKFHLQIRPVELINLQLEVKDDDLGSSTFIGGYLEIPFSLESLFSGKNPFARLKETLAFGKGARPFRQRMSDKIIRDRHIVAPVFNEHQPTTVAKMIYVNADNSGAGTGTYSDPYQSAASVTGSAAFQNGTWIYIFSSDDTADTHTVNLTLLPGMVLWGEGAGFKNIAPGGPHPILDGLGGDVVTLANNNEVMGLQIQGGGFGITANVTTAGDSISHRIHDNRIVSNAAGGIHLQNKIADPTRLAQVSISNQIYNNTISGNTGDGVWLDNYIEAPQIQNGFVDNHFSNNSITANSSDGIQLYNHLYAFQNIPGSDVAAGIRGAGIRNTFNGNTISANTASGVYFQSNEMVAEASYTAADLSGHITAEVAGASITNTFGANTISNNGSYGVDIGKNHVKSYAKADTINVSGNVKSGVIGLVIRNTFAANMITGNTNDGVHINDNRVDARTEAYNTPVSIGGEVAATVSGASVAHSVTDNLITNNDDGFYVNSNHTEAYAELDNAAVAGNVSGSVTASPFAATFSGNDILNNTNAGIYADSEIYAYARAYGSISPSTVGGNLAAAVSGSAVSSNFAGNTLTNNKDGIYINSNDSYVYAQVDNASTVTGAVTGLIKNNPVKNTFSQNRILANNGYGVYIDNDPEVYAGADNASSVGSLTAAIFNAPIDNTVSGNTIASNKYNLFVRKNLMFSEALLDNGSAAGGSVTGSIEYSPVRNRFDQNDLSNATSSNGVRIESNHQYAYARADNASTAGGDMAAGIANSAAINTFTANTIDNNNQYGVFLEDFEVAAESKAMNASVITGALGAAVSNSPVVNAFSGNDLSGNSSRGVYFKDIDINVHALAESSSSVGGDATAALSDSRLSGTFTGNIISGNSSGAGVYFFDGYAADAGVRATNATVGGSALADITRSSIAYTFSDNQISGNGGQGISISGNRMVFSTKAESLSTIGGDMTGRMSDSSIALTLTGNTIRSNQGNGFELTGSNFVGSNPDAAQVFNLVSASVGGNATAALTNVPITNTFTGNDISANQGRGVYMSTPGLIDAHIIANGTPLSSVSGNITAAVGSSAITNTFRNNTISLNTNTGVNLGLNQITGYGSLADDGTAGGQVSGLIGTSPIRNTFTANDISGNQGRGIYFNYAAWLDASGSVSGTAASAGGDISGSISASSVDNTFSANTIKYNDDHGVYFQAGNEIHAWGSIDSGTAAGSVTGAVNSSPVSNTFSGNDISSNDNYGIYLTHNFSDAYGKATGTAPVVSGSVAGSVSGSAVTNTFGANTVSYNNARGIYLENRLRAYGQLADATVTGDVTAGISDAIRNNFTGNTVSGNAGNGIHLLNRVDADTQFDGTSSAGGTLTVQVDQSEIDNLFYANTVNNNTGYGINVSANALYAALSNNSALAAVVGDVQVSVAGSRIQNDLVANEVNGTNTTDGVSLVNDLYADAAFPGSVGGDLSVFVNPSGIENAFSSNRIGLSDGRGVFIDNEMYARRTGGGTVTGSADASLIGSVIRDRFWSDAITGNDSDGIYLQSDTSSTTDGQDVTLKLFMQGGHLLNNDGYGLYTTYTGAGVVSGDLGGGVLGSTGRNIFSGSFNEDVYNNTGTAIKAERNWWGDFDPSDQVGGNPVDHDPSLTSAP